MITSPEFQFLFCVKKVSKGRTLTHRTNLRLTTAMNPSVIENGFTSTTDGKNRWQALVEMATADNRLRGSTCPYYSQQMTLENRNENEMCRCDQLLKNHDFEHVFESENTKRKSAQLHTFVKMSAANSGSLENNTRVRRPYVSSVMFYIF